MPLDHPYNDLANGQWLRGNLHTHTTASDGEREAQLVIDDYAQRGYGFLALSDHDIYSGPPRYDTLDSKGLVLIPGNEISAGGPHMLHIDCRTRVEPDPERQTAIDAANADGGFVVINHPNWQTAFDHCPLENMHVWQNYLGMEIYNGVISRLDGSPYATNKWDMLLAAGRRVLGFANDDSHAAVGDIELGWNTAYVTDRSPAGVVAALKAGRFYASTGVTISDIAVSDMHIHLETQNARRIVALRDTGKRIATVDSRSIDLEVPAGAKYVRFECWGDGEQFAWTQAFYVTQG